MQSGLSNEYTSASFPRILKPQAAQVFYLMQQLNDYARADAERQQALQAMNLSRLFRWAHAHSPYWATLLAARGAPDFSQPWQRCPTCPSCAVRTCRSRWSN